VKSNRSVVRVGNFNKFEKSVSKEEYSDYFTVKNTKYCKVSNYDIVYVNKDGSSLSLSKA
jgi:hypothetical protein